MKKLFIVVWATKTDCDAKKFPELQYHHYFETFTEESEAVEYYEEKKSDDRVVTAAITEPWTPVYNEEMLMNL